MPARLRSRLVGAMRRGGGGGFGGNKVRGMEQLFIKGGEFVEGGFALSGDAKINKGELLCECKRIVGDGLDDLTCNERKREGKRLSTENGQDCL